MIIVERKKGAPFRLKGDVLDPKEGESILEKKILALIRLEVLKKGALPLSIEFIYNYLNNRKREKDIYKLADITKQFKEILEKTKRRKLVSKKLTAEEASQYWSQITKYSHKSKSKDAVKELKEKNLNPGDILMGRLVEGGEASALRFKIRATQSHQLLSFTDTVHSAVYIRKQRIVDAIHTGVVLRTPPRKKNLYLVYRHISNILNTPLYKDKKGRGKTRGEELANTSEKFANEVIKNWKKIDRKDPAFETLTIDERKYSDGYKVPQAEYNTLGQADTFFTQKKKPRVHLKPYQAAKEKWFCSQLTKYLLDKTTHLSSHSGKGEFRSDFEERSDVMPGRLHYMLYESPDWFLVGYWKVGKK